jgi:hypothetical protein
MCQLSRSLRVVPVVAVSWLGLSVVGRAISLDYQGNVFSVLSLHQQLCPTAF